MSVYQNGKRDVGTLLPPQPAASPDNVEVQELLAQLAALTKSLAAAQGIPVGTDVDPVEALQKLAEAGANIEDGKIVDGDIGVTDVVKGDEKSRKTLDLLNDL